MSEKGGFKVSIIKRGKGGIDLFAIDQSPQMYLLSEKGGFKVLIIKGAGEALVCSS